MEPRVSPNKPTPSWNTWVAPRRVGLNSLEIQVLTKADINDEPGRGELHSEKTVALQKMQTQVITSASQSI